MLLRTTCWFLLSLLVLPLSGHAQDAGAPLADADAKLYFGPCAPFADDMTFECYRSYDEVAQFLQDAAASHANLAQLASMGKTFEGRDLWVLTVTDFNTGPPEDKPGIWIDGGVDSDEVVATEAALGLVHRLLTSDDPEVARLRQTRVFYIAPNVIPDMSERHHKTPLRPRDSTMRPWDDDKDGQFDEDGPDDLDGDGQALQMRHEDPSGEWVKDEEDPRLMRRRKPDDAGPFYNMYSEGLDNDGDDRYNEDWPGGVDPNRNYPGNWSARQRGSGPYPGSEVELRAMLDFIYAHPNIAASQHLHSSGGVILRPPSVPDMTLPARDLNLYIALAERGLAVTGYPLATSVYDWNWPRGTSNKRRGQLWRDPSGEVQGMAPFEGGNLYGQYSGSEDAYAAYGGSLDGLYELFGILAFANEIYRFGDDLDGDGRVSPAEQLRYDDEHMNGEVFQDWTPFAHPTLGGVEIGGWKKFGHNNPLPADLPREVERNVDFVLMQARATPLLAITGVEQTDLGAGVYRLKATVANLGFQPTELAIREQTRRAVPVRATLTVNTPIVPLTEEIEQDLGQVMGHAETHVTWLVRGPAGAAVTMEVYHPKAGRATHTVGLGQ